MTTLAMYPGRDLPPVVQRAIARASDPTILKDLSPTNRWALSILLRRASAEDGTDIIWVKRSNFAQLMNVSEATVYRMLGALEGLGMIERVKQKRDTEGAFTVGEIRFSDALCRLLGLTRDRDESTLYKRTRPRLSTLQDASNTNQGVKQFSSKKHSQSDFAESENREPRAARGQIPNDLVPLAEKGLTHPQIFLLMRLASRAGKRLGHIVGVCWPALDKLHSAELFAYIRKLTTTQVDFTHLHTEQTLEKTRQTVRQELCGMITSLKARYSRRWLRSLATGCRFFVDEHGFAAVYEESDKGWRRSGVIAGPADEKFWLAVKEGTLVEAPALQ